jgi:hypothetical protein
MYLPTDEDNTLPHHKKKKNTKKWCKGKVGREHVPHIIKSNYGVTDKCCNYAPWSVRHKNGETTPLKKYLCWHQRSCQNCGKVLEWFLSEEECPDYKEPDA